MQAPCTSSSCTTPSSSHLPNRMLSHMQLARHHSLAFEYAAVMAPLACKQWAVHHAQGRMHAGVIARQRKNEVEELNERLRKINLSLRQQARVSTMYAPGLTYAPRDVDATPSGSGSDSGGSSGGGGGGGGPSSASTATFNWQPLVRTVPRVVAHAVAATSS